MWYSATICWVCNSLIYGLAANEVSWFSFQSSAYLNLINVLFVVTSLLEISFKTKYFWGIFISHLLTVLCYCCTFLKVSLPGANSYLRFFPLTAPWLFADAQMELYEEIKSIQTTFRSSSLCQRGRGSAGVKTKTHTHTHTLKEFHSSAHHWSP